MSTTTTPAPLNNNPNFEIGWTISGPGIPPGTVVVKITNPPTPTQTTNHPTPTPTALPNVQCIWTFKSDYNCQTKQWGPVEYERVDCINIYYPPSGIIVIGDWSRDMSFGCGFTSKYSMASNRPCSGGPFNEIPGECPDPTEFPPPPPEIIILSPCCPDNLQANSITLDNPSETVDRGQICVHSQPKTIVHMGSCDSSPFSGGSFTVVASNLNSTSELNFQWQYLHSSSPEDWRDISSNSIMATGSRSNELNVLMCKPVSQGGLGDTFRVILSANNATSVISDICQLSFIQV